MTKVVDAPRTSGGSLFISDFTPPRGPDPSLLEGARQLTKGFVAVAYNPGKLVRVDSATAAFQIRERFGREVIFNLSPRDMNKIALESRLLGAAAIGLENVLVVQGDPITDRDGVQAVAEYSATSLIQAISNLNKGTDYRASKLRSSCDFCIGAGIDLGKELANEIGLTFKKVQSGAHFLVTQPVFA